MSYKINYNMSINLDNPNTPIVIDSGNYSVKAGQ